MNGHDIHYLDSLILHKGDFMSFSHVLFLGALIFSTSTFAADYKASCKTKSDGAFCTVSLYSCDQVSEELATDICQNEGWANGTIDPNGELIGQDSYQCGIDAVGPYTYVGCSN